jgi:hypothetical protein
VEKIHGNEGRMGETFALNAPVLGVLMVLCILMCLLYIKMHKIFQLLSGLETRSEFASPIEAPDTPAIPIVEPEPLQAETECNVSPIGAPSPLSDFVKTSITKKL